MNNEFHLFHWAPEDVQWHEVTRGTEADMNVRLGKLMDAARVERKREFAAFVSPSPFIPEQPPAEINIEVHDFGAPDTEFQMSNLEAVFDYLSTARRYVGQAVDEMSEVDYSPLMPTDVAVRLGLISHSVLMSLDEALSYITTARSKGRKALLRKEVD